MHHDSAVNTAVRTITENVPDVEVVEYGSLEYALTIHRVVGRVVWVSHGSKAGILTATQRMTWRSFSSRLEMTLGNDIVLTCDSSEIYKYSTTTSVIGFTGLVDARLGGIYTSFLLSTSRTRSDAITHIVTEFINYLTKLLSGEVTPQYLYIPSDGGGGGGGSTPVDYDFIYREVYFSAYNSDPNNEVYYDHPSYATYYRLRGVGVADAFTIEGDNLRIDHIDRNTINFWKLGGLLTLAALLYNLGVAAAMTIFGMEASPILFALGALLTAIGWTASLIVNTMLADEKGGGWVFYKYQISKFKIDEYLSCTYFLVDMKLGKMYWLRCEQYQYSNGIELSFVNLLLDKDGHYIK